MGFQSQNKLHSVRCDVPSRTHSAKIAAVPYFPSIFACERLACSLRRKSLNFLSGKCFPLLPLYWIRPFTSQSKLRTKQAPQIENPPWICPRNYFKAVIGGWFSLPNKVLNQKGLFFKSVKHSTFVVQPTRWDQWCQKMLVTCIRFFFTRSLFTEQQGYWGLE